MSYINGNSDLDITLMFSPLSSLHTGTMERAADREGEQGGEEVAPIQEARTDPQGSPPLADSPAPQQVRHQVMILLLLPPLPSDSGSEMMKHVFCL